MEDYLGPLVTGDDIRKVLANRKNPRVYKTLFASKQELLEEKVRLEEKDGWKVSKMNKRSVRMEKTKLSDEYLEDELWCIAAEMGFHELSAGRNFKISISDEQDPRQIDVFAKDKETAILIECTHGETNKKKNMENLINKIVGIQNNVRNSINKHYGKDPKLKIRWIIASRNVNWSESDLKKAEEARIWVLRDKEIDYYNSLVNLIKSAARYQFLAHIFAGEEIHGLKLSVAATKGKIGKTIFYNFLIKPSDLLKISYISHRGGRDAKEIETYQRMLKRSRLKQIAEFINNGGIFPTNIVINIKTRKSLDFRNKRNIGDYFFGELHLPPYYATAWIIDGQHRLYGYAYSNYADSSLVPVLAFDKLSPKKEAEMFVDINSEQIKVSKNLFIELYSELHWNSTDPEERLLALSSRVANNLGTDASSPIRGRILISGYKKSPFVCLSLTNISDGLLDNKLLGDIHGSQLRPGPLSVLDNDLAKSLKKSTNVISRYLRFFSDPLSEHWKLGDAPSGYLCTNNSIRSLLLVLRHLCQHLEKVIGISCDKLDADELVSHLEPYCTPLVTFFKNASPAEIKTFRDQQGGLKGISKQANMMMQHIHKLKPEFNPSGLKEYIESQDIEGTQEAGDLIHKIQRMLFENVFGKLKTSYGKSEGEFWQKGVPANVRKDCAQKKEDDIERKNIEQYITLIDYYSIAKHNWELFKEEMALFTKDGGSDRQLAWIKDLNRIRNCTDHPEKWPITRKEVEFVRDVIKKIIERFNASNEM